MLKFDTLPKLFVMHGVRKRYKNSCFYESEMGQAFYLQPKKDIYRTVFDIPININIQTMNF
jgi:hypothetical protein